MILYSHFPSVMQSNYSLLYPFYYILTYFGSNSFINLNCLCFIVLSYVLPSLYYLFSLGNLMQPKQVTFITKPLKWSFSGSKVKSMKVYYNNFKDGFQMPVFDSLKQHNSQNRALKHNSSSSKSEQEKSNIIFVLLKLSSSMLQYADYVSLVYLENGATKSMHRQE